MNIFFENEKLRQICENDAQMKKKLGTKAAKKLKRRLADLMAADSVTDLVAGRPHPLKQDRLGQFALDLDGGKRLIFEAAHEPIPLTADDAIDWSKVKNIRIVEIGDYHD
ncbi:killer suppression protein HigA [Bradymonadaceae bacterium TMQ3]|nr:killer suppression protein HigA [Bradymonadaceae bacterium TMQ3]TXC75460.1 killer suppression protein HigA [Bradymonadales bacterium TMQ1]